MTATSTESILFEAPTGLPLVIESLTVRFGGVHAVETVSLEIKAGETVGLIGSNGAGKTTLMDCVSGYVRPTSGTITLFGKDVTRLPPELRPYVGLGRSFQDARLYPGLTVLETLMVALERHAPTGLLAGLFGLAVPNERAKRHTADELVELMGLESFAEKRAGELSTGTRRIVDLACIVAQQPKLLLLDEPTAGIAQRETEAFGPMLLRLKEMLGFAVLLIEHDMPLVTGLADRIYAMESGQVIAEGRPADVIKDPWVVASYLGTTDAAIQRSDHALLPAKRRAPRKRVSGPEGSHSPTC
jgi:ABC-type branched-subunit amino acid transport system ATPase component